MVFKDCSKLVRKYIQEYGSNVIGYISSIESLDTFVYTFATEYNAKFFGRIHRGFGVAFSQLQNMFGN